MRGSTTGLTATVAAVLAALSGCAGSPAPSVPDAGPARGLTQTEQIRVDQAEQRLIQQCMKRSGFRYRVAPPADADTLRAFTHRFVQHDVAWAHKHGYGENLKKAFFSTKGHDPNITYRKRLSPAERRRYTAALTGGPDTPTLSVRLPAGGAIRTLDGGCEHFARRKLYGDTAAFFRADKIATNAFALYMPKLMRDPRFTTGLNAWSRCMRGATGRAYANPDAARADARNRARGLSKSRAHVVEVEVAVAEATCADKTALPWTLSSLDHKYGDPVRARYAAEIATSNRMRLDALRQADLLDDRD
ncbi:hypothetical protein [Streptomyces sp. NPDC047070]|uniref:hypothetical protein n=1 Tax=Streptomyces sp. NPDC047070 TaxID=3154923 RepID=UPI003453338D